MPPYRQRSCVLFFGPISKRTPCRFLECTVRRWALNPFRRGIQMGFVTPNRSVPYCVGPNGPRYIRRWPANRKGRAGVQTNKWTHTYTHAQGTLKCIPSVYFISLHFRLPNWRCNRESADKEKWTITKLREMYFRLAFKFIKSLSYLNLLLSTHKVFLEVQHPLLFSTMFLYNNNYF